MSIFKVAQYVVIHLKRFRAGEVRKTRGWGGGYGYRSTGGGKLDKEIAFPLTGLDLTDHVIHPDTPEEYFKGKKEKSDIQEEKKKILYDLYAVSNHYGSMGFGHYTAYVKNPKNNKWYDMDDSRVG